jgi:hypothetical protein
MNTAYLQVRLMELLQRHRGRDNAIPREKLLFELQSIDPKLDDRRFREIYSALPICTSKAGMFIATKPEEVQEFKEYLTNGWGPLVAARRVKIVFAYFPSLAVSSMKQRDLGI